MISWKMIIVLKHLYKVTGAITNTVRVLQWNKHMCDDFIVTHLSQTWNKHPSKYICEIINPPQHASVDIDIIKHPPPSCENVFFFLTLFKYLVFKNP